MRQSNSAIKYLMAQYSAIIKHAYVKGIASAVVLGAGLTATTSQAAENNGATSPKDSDSLGNSEYADGNTVPSNIKIRGGASKLFDVRTVAFNKASSANNDLGSELKGAAEDQLGGTVHVSSSVIPGLSDDPIKANVVNITSKETFRGNNTTHYSRNLNIKSGGKLSLVDTPLYVNGNLNMLGELYVYGDGSDIVLGSDQVKDTAYTNSKLNMKSGSRLDIKNSSGIKAAVGEVNSGTVVLRGEGSYIYAYGNGSSWKLSNPQDIKEGDVAGANLKFNKARLDINGKSGYVGSLNNVSFKDSELNLNGENSAVEALGHNLQQEPSAGLKFNHTNINVSGTASNIGAPRFVAPNISFEKNSNLKIQSGATLALRGEKDPNLNTYEASKITFQSSTIDNDGTMIVYGNMHMDGDSKLNGSNSTVVVNSVGKNTLNSQDVSDDALGFGRLSFDKSQTLQDYLSSGGSVLLRSGGTLNFNEVTDLASFNYNSTSTPWTNSGTAGTIVVSESEETYITGKDLTLSEALQSGGQVLSNSKLFVKADHVTLGDDNKLAPEDGNFGVEGIIANDLTLKSSGVFVLGHDLKIKNNGFYFDHQAGSPIEKNQPANLKVQDLQLGSNMPAGKSGYLNIAGGDWQTTSNIKIEKGSLDVKSEPIDQTNSPYGNPTIFTLQNGSSLSFSGTDVDSAKLNIIGASGASAVVDLRESNLDTAAGSGSINVSGNTTNGKLSDIQDLDQLLQDYYQNNDDLAAYAMEASKKIGYGMVKLTNDQIKELTSNNSKVGINIGGGGIVTVDNFNGDIEVKSITGGTNAQGGQIAFNNGQDDALLDLGKGLVNFKAYANESGNIVLNIGNRNATISAGSMDFTQYKDRNDVIDDGSFKIEGGNFNIASSLRSKNSQLTLSNNTVFELETENPGDTGKIEIASFSANNIPSGGTNGQLILEGNAALHIKRGNWYAGDVDLDNSGEIRIYEDPGLNVSLTASNYNGKASSSFVIDKGTQVELDTMQLANGHKLDVNGKLLVNGLDPNNIDQNSPAYIASGSNGVALNGDINVKGANALLEFGKDASAGLIKYSGGSVVIDKALSDATFNVELAQVKFNLDKSVELNSDHVNELVNEILGPNNINGVLNLGDATLKVKSEDLGNGYYEVNWSDLEDFNSRNDIIGNVTTDNLLDSVINLGSTNQGIKGHYAAFKGGSTDIELGGPTSLHGAAGNDGFFISKNGSNGKEAANVTLDSNSSLILANGGKIGAITGTGTGTGTGGTNTLSIINDLGNNTATDILGDVSKLDGLDIKADTNIYGNVSNLGTMNVQAGTEIGGNVSNIQRMNVKANTRIAGNFSGDRIDLEQASLDIQGDMSLKQFIIAQNGNIKARTAEIVAQGSGQNASQILGRAEFETLNLKSQANNINALDVHGDLSTKDLAMDASMQNVGISVGAPAATGNLEVKGRFTFGNGSNRLVVASDPTNNGVNLASLSNLAGTGSSTSDAGTLDGDLLVGGNSAVGIGTSDINHLKTALGDSYNPSAKASLYLAKSMKVGSSGSMMIAGDKSLSDLGSYIESFNQSNNISNPKISYDATNGFKLSDQTIYLGSGGAIIVDQTVADNADMNKLGSNAVAMIDFEDKGVPGVVIADGGKIQISGTIRETKYKVFENAEIEYLDQTKYDLANANYADKKIEITTANGLVKGYLDENGEVDLKVNANSRSILSRATRSVHDTLIDYVDGYRGQAPVYGYDANGNQTTAYRNDLLEHDTNGGNGESSEQAARLGVYGGSAQAALAVADTSTNAITSRFGVGSSTTAANVSKLKNSRSFGLWAAPVYNTKKSSGFNNEDKAYGVDVNLGGVAVGGDFEVAPNLRVGAMVNVGKGSVNGNQIASNVSNDFKYYGLGAYVGYEFDKLSVVGDMSYSVVDNDISASNDFEKLHSSFNTKNLSMGVTGQYVFDVGNDMVIVPHAGLRFNRVDLENYSVSGSKKYAEFSGDNLNTLSLPIGVKLAKNFVTDDWRMTPSVDLTLTSNFGDTSLDGSTSWVNNAGMGMIQNLDTHINSQIMDDFTYGIGAGFTATNGAFSAGMGLNYTGSSNTNEFGVQANFRMDF